MKNKKIALLFVSFSTAFSLSACETTSGVMDTGGGTYMISAQTDKLLGGAAAANRVAYENANTFCSKQGGHAIVLNLQSRDVIEGSVSGDIGPGGNSDLRFRCSAISSQ